MKVEATRTRTFGLPLDRMVRDQGWSAGELVLTPFEGNGHFLDGRYRSASLIGLPGAPDVFPMLRDVIVVSATEGWITVRGLECGRAAGLHRQEWHVLPECPSHSWRRNSFVDLDGRQARHRGSTLVGA